MNAAWMIVGLGNPGERYANTRHNLGWRAVQRLAEEHGLAFKEESKFNAFVAKGTIGETQIYLILPTTYMNLSGVAVANLLHYYKLPRENLVIVVDDVALPFGQMRLRNSGSAGGHNGLKSIEAYLSTQEYLRLRLGIDREQPKRELSDFVLERFSAEEMEQLPSIEKKAAEALENLLVKGPEQTMNLVNPKLT